MNTQSTTVSPVTVGAEQSAPTAHTAALKAANLKKRFGETVALRDCSIEAFAGEIHAIIGENGSGKSTLIKIVSGVLRADDGELRVNGELITKQGPREMLELGVATAFQEILTADTEPLVDNVFAGFDGFIRSTASRDDRIRECRELMSRLVGEDIDPLQPVGSFPLNIRQWITIARALVRKPKVLILDESTAALDLDAAARVLQELERLRDEGVCILIVTHRIAELTVFADRATVLRDGATVATIERKDITEERLLALMTGDETSGHRPDAGESATIGAIVLDVANAQLSPSAPQIAASLRSGEILGLAGLDGHGQREFIDLLAGILPCGQLTSLTSGSPQVVRGFRSAAKQGIVYVPGERKREGIFPHHDLLRNFGVPTFHRNSRFGFISRRRARSLYDKYRDRLSVKAASPKSLITSLSGGNQQKIIIGRWLAANPHVVLMNDPTRGVDIGTKHDLYRVLRELAREGRAIVLLSTELEELVEVCDRVLVFRNQGIEREMSGDSISTDAILAAMFGRTGIDQVLAVVDSAAHNPATEGEAL